MPAPARPLSGLSLLAGGAAALMVSNGIGRFAFTPILPLMQADQGFSDAAAGVMASANLVGYLLGAISCGRISPAFRAAAYRWSLVLAVAGLGAMALPLGVPAWTVIRFIAGIASALVYVLGTAFILESGAARHPLGAGLHFGGVGLGIVLSGVLVQFEHRWPAAWSETAVLCLILCLPAWNLPAGAARLSAADTAARPKPAQTEIGANWPFRLLAAAYWLEGLGYVVSGTFLVRVLHSLPQTAHLGPLVWVIVGAAATPSFVGWGWVARRIGAWRALTLAFALQAVGIVLPLTGNPAATLVSAVLFGGTFMGIAGIILIEGAALRPKDIARATARLTILFGIGQAIGPVAAGFLATRFGGFTWPLLGAALATALAGLLAWIGQRTAPQTHR